MKTSSGEGRAGRRCGRGQLVRIGGEQLAGPHDVAGRRRTGARGVARRTPACTAGRRCRRRPGRRRATARGRPACPAPASRVRRRGPGSARRPWSPSAAPRGPRAPAGRRAAGPRAATGAARRPCVRTRWTPRRRRRARPQRPASSSARTGAMPEPSRPLEVGQCATPVPVAANRPTASSDRCTQCASHTSDPEPAEVLGVLRGRAAEGAGRQNASSSRVSARWVCSRTLRARASSALSRISSAGHRERRAGRERDAGHRVRRRVVPAVDRVGAGGEDRVVILDDRVRRQPAGRLAEVHRPAGGVEADADLARGADLGLEQVAGAVREDVVVIRRRRGAGQRHPGQVRRRRRVHPLRR